MTEPATHKRSTKLSKLLCGRRLLDSRGIPHKLAPDGERATCGLCDRGDQRRQEAMHKAKLLRDPELHLLDAIEGYIAAVRDPEATRNTIGHQHAMVLSARNNWKMFGGVR